MKYRITADYHTHTRYSHGKGTIEDNVRVARDMGLKSIAIADHGFSRQLMEIGVAGDQIKKWTFHYPFSSFHRQ
jgi:putative hydrolase